MKTCVASSSPQYGQPLMATAVEEGKHLDHRGLCPTLTFLFLPGPGHHAGAVITDVLRPSLVLESQNMPRSLKIGFLGILECLDDKKSSERIVKFYKNLKNKTQNRE